jgi:predicted aminopeptidase
VLLALACPLLSGCGSLSYLTHVSLGQLNVLLARESLTPERIAQLTPEEQDRLERMREARRFGATLGLSDSTGYRHLLDRTAEESVTVVVAAPPDRLEPVTWWFPIAGRISYRGYFDAERANEFADSLAAEGYDTYVRRAAAYSTLGWFDDPVPRPLLSWPEVDAVETALHELVHESIFVPGDPDYNEALATFIGEQATLRFLADRPELVTDAEAGFADRLRFARLLAALGDDLRELYARAESREQAIARRASVFAHYQGERFRAESWQTRRFSGFPERELSNAYLVAQSTYLGELACLEAWLRRLDGDLERFIAVQKEAPGQRPEELPACQS